MKQKYETSKNLEDQSTKNTTSKICCVECGSNNSTLHKIMRNGSKAYLCDYCFKSMRDD